jgi:DNA-binding response OmpR family regulator
MGARILVVEDSAVFRRPLECWLAAGGYDVTAVETGEQALDSLDRADVNLVITDRGLPGIGGTELVRRIRTEHPAVPIVLMSADATWDVESAQAEAGVDAALLKPFEPEVLLAAVTRALGGSARKESPA